MPIESRRGGVHFIIGADEVRIGDQPRPSPLNRVFYGQHGLSIERVAMAEAEVVYVVLSPYFGVALADLVGHGRVWVRDSPLNRMWAMTAQALRNVDPATGTVQFFTPSGGGGIEHWLPDLLAQIRRTHPDADIGLADPPSAKVARALANAGCSAIRLFELPRRSCYVATWARG